MTVENGLPSKETGEEDINADKPQLLELTPRETELTNLALNTSQIEINKILAGATLTFYNSNYEDDEVSSAVTLDTTPTINPLEFQHTSLITLSSNNTQSLNPLAPSSSRTKETPNHTVLPIPTELTSMKSSDTISFLPH